eukprot:m51a1_g1258 hypothetical protein (414) ;mRNA; f:46721-48206
MTAVVELVGHQQQQQKLLSSLSRVVSGEHAGGAFVVLVGAPCAGKSQALANALASLALAHGGRDPFLRLGVSKHTEPSTDAVVAELSRQLAAECGTLGIDPSSASDAGSCGSDATDELVAAVRAASARRPVLVVVDGLEQYCAAHRASSGALDAFEEKKQLPSVIAEMMADGCRVACVAMTTLWTIDERIIDRVRSRGYRSLFFRSLSREELAELAASQLLAYARPLGWEGQAASLCDSAEWKAFAQSSAFPFDPRGVKSLVAAALARAHPQAPTIDHFTEAAKTNVSSSWLVADTIASDLTENEAFVLVALAAHPAAYNGVHSHAVLELLRLSENWNPPVSQVQRLFHASLGSLLNKQLVVSSKKGASVSALEGFCNIHLAIDFSTLRMVVDRLRELNRCTTDLNAFAARIP